MQAWSSEAYAKRQDSALKQFGAMLRRWRTINGWTQYTTSEWGKAAGFETPGPSNWSTMERGVSGNLKASTLFALGGLNAKIHSGELGITGNPELRALLEGSRAIETPDGKPWGPTEFWACSVGELEPPEWLRGVEVPPAPALNAAEVKVLVRGWRDHVARLINEYDLDPVDALQGAAAGLPRDERVRFRKVLTGAAEYSAKELRDGWDGQWSPEKSIEAWAMQLLHKRPPASDFGETANGA
jgi:transcriptional regulator with XRE-family HTH domain